MKKLALLILAAMLIGTAASCSSQSTDSGTPSEDTTASQQTEVTEPVDPNLPEFEAKYGGKDFRVIYPTHANFQYQHSDTETGDSVEDALYKRDITIEDQFEVDMKYTVVDKIEAVYDTVSQNILAGDDSFDLILNHVNWQINAYIAEKFVLDWYTVNNVDLEKPYWNQNMNDSLAIGDVLPVAASDYVVANPLMLFFNTEMVKSMGLDDQYELVNNGKWTWDVLSKTSAEVMTDINGDGTMNADDRYGFVVDITGSSYMLRSIPASANQFIYSKGNDGSLKCTVNTPQMQVMLEKLVSLFNGGGAYLLNYGGPQDNVKAVAHFNKGTTLYYLVDSLKAFAYRDIDFEYGILPLPKYDEKQEQYASLNWSGLMLIPVTAPDPDMVGCISEWLAYYSARDVQPVFFEILMDEKVARDDTSADMLKLIFSTLVYDPAINYKSKGFYSFFDELVKGNRTDLASYYAGKEAAELEYIEQLNEYFNAFKG